MPGVPHAIVSREGDIVAIVPDNIVGQVMTSALIPNMGYRMECRPATEDEIYRLLRQLVKSRYRIVAGVGQQAVLIRDPRGASN